MQVPGAPAHDAIVFSNADIAQVSSIEAARVAAHAVAVAMEEATDAAPGTQANNAAGVAASGAAAAGGAPSAAAGQSGDGAPPAVPLAPAGSAPAIPPARLAENEPHSDNDELTATQASAEEIERGKQLYSEIQVCGTRAGRERRRQGDGLDYLPCGFVFLYPFPAGSCAVFVCLATGTEKDGRGVA